MPRDPEEDPEDRPTELFTSVSVPPPGPDREPPEPTASVVSWEPTPFRFSAELARSAAAPPVTPGRPPAPAQRAWIQALGVVLVLWGLCVGLVLWWASTQG